MTIPPAPPQNPRNRRYPMSTVTLARRMYGNGGSWTPTQIRDYLRQNVPGCEAVTENTVRLWVIPAEAEAQRMMNSASYHRRKKNGRRAAPAPYEERRRRVIELRSAGLSVAAVAKVIRLDFGVTYSLPEIETMLPNEMRKPSRRTSRARFEPRRERATA